MLYEESKMVTNKNKKQLRYALAAIAAIGATAEEGVLQTAVDVKVNANGNGVREVGGPVFRRLGKKEDKEADLKAAVKEADEKMKEISKKGKDAYGKYRTFQRNSETSKNAFKIINEAKTEYGPAANKFKKAKEDLEEYSSFPNLSYSFFRPGVCHIKSMKHSSSPLITSVELPFSFFISFSMQHNAAFCSS